MKLKIFFFLCFALGEYSLYSGVSTNKINDYHVGIGNKLIKLKKDFPVTEQVAYSLLDQFGKYSSFSRSLIQKKKNYKKLLKEEIETSERLKKEINKLSEKISDMKNKNLEASKKFNEIFEQFKTRFKNKGKELKDRNKIIEDLNKQFQDLIVERDSLKNLLEERSFEKTVQNDRRDSNLTSNSAPISPL